MLMILSFKMLSKIQNNNNKKKKIAHNTIFVQIKISNKINWYTIPRPNILGNLNHILGKCS